ncbi:MAG: ATP-binding cassette domain-containing protein, partial [Bacteroidales bacterium]|nr:ATP-binding cassette domain-containing protein [Bacteroidales bacterium]
SDEKKVIDVVKDIAEIMPMGDGRSLTASQLLSWFMFPPKVQQQQVSLLSGGEQRRLYLLTVLVRNPNFLILDEPTNDLDLLTLQTLEAFLQNFKGCLIVVTHDRYFMDQVVDQLFVFEGEGKVRGFVGNYSDYKERQDEQQRIEKEAAAKLAPPKKTKSETASSVRKKRSYKEQKEFEQLATDLQSLEKEKHQLTEKLSTLSDYQDIEQTANRIKAIDAALDEKEMRWLELDELG